MSLFRTTIICQQWVELVTDYLEGALPRRTVRAIERHLSGCPHCTEYLAQMRRTIAISGALPEDHEVPDELIERLRRALEEQRRDES